MKKRGVGGIRVVGFDADDTLWANMEYFGAAEKRFCELLAGYGDAGFISAEQYRTELANIPLYGYGVKGFTLSLIETALRLSGGAIGAPALSEILAIGKAILDHPVELLDGVAETLQALRGKYTMILATKGDLLHQERKLERSGLAGHFHHIEVMPDKTEREFARLLRRLDLRPEEFAMVGDSLRSDILPVLALGGAGVHVPYSATWQHEEAAAPAGHPRFFPVASIREVVPLLS